MLCSSRFKNNFQQTHYCYQVGIRQNKLLVKMMYLAIVFIATLTTSLVTPCSVYCPDDTGICVNEVWYGPLGASCGGFLGCVNETTPCNGECSASNPVISIDGQTCSPCAYENETSQKRCTDCQTRKYHENFWCIEEEQCKLKNATCNDRCPLPSYPEKDEAHCNRCPFGNLWCSEELRCYNPVSEPCNQECYKDSLNKYCPATNSCVKIWLTCDTFDEFLSSNDAVNFP